jgi:glutathione S-transferase
MLKLIGVARSRNFRCLWAAEEAGTPYQHVELGFGPELKGPEYAEINPNQKLPAMQDGGLTLFESLAINLHIARKAGPPLMPGGDDSSRVLQWTLWAATEAEPNAMKWATNTFMAPAEQRSATEAAAGKAALDQRLGVLDRHLQGREWLVGDSFSIADCNLAGVLYGSWFNNYDYSRFPAVKAWLDRCLNRPAALKARKLREG